MPAIETLIDPHVLARLMEAFPDSSLIDDEPPAFPALHAETVTLIDRIEVAPGLFIDRTRTVIRSTSPNHHHHHQGA